LQLGSLPATTPARGTIMLISQACQGYVFTGPHNVIKSHMGIHFATHSSFMYNRRRFTENTDHR
jgi:hypothetical protein